MARVKALIKLGNEGTRLFTSTFDEFQAYNVTKNLRKATINTYSHYKTLLSYYYLTYNESLDSFSPDLITSSFITNFTHYLATVRQNSTVSINTALRHIRAFANFCSEHGYMKPIKIKLLKVDKVIKEPYTPDEMAILLKKPKMNKGNWLEYRNWVLITYMYGTGNRIGSISEIQNKDVDLAKGKILLQHTKNRQQQYVSLTPKLQSILREYMSIRQGADSDYLFCNQSGARLQVQAIVQAIHDYNIARGVIKTSCHLFRHTYAISWLQNGGSIVELQAALGHSDISMTMEYVNLAHIDLQANIAAFNPLERFNIVKQKTMFIKA